MTPRIAVPYWDEQYLLAYAAAIRREGAEVVPLAMRAVTNAAAALTDVRGLMLIGGGDVAPDRFGAADPTGLSSRVEPQRDEFELTALGDALARDLPVLAICRGQQVLAVARGGALHLDLPTEVAGSLGHRRAKDYLDAHPVAVAPGSRLAAAMDATALVVNSRHHQAVRADAPGRDLVVTGRSPDGIVEALESTAHGFVVGVQWHPETFVGRGERFAPLFRAFVARVAGAREGSA